jgi:RNA polymerase sigma-70 factor, ECF subfamily
VRGKSAVQSDSELVAAVRAGDIGAYAALVGRYERIVRASVLRKTGDSHATEDAVQDAFLIAYESLASLRTAERFGAWLLGIAKNRAARTLQEKIRREHSVDDFDALPHDSNRRLSEQSLELLELVERLPEHERVVVGLKHFEGYTAAEIAAITGSPLGTITKQLSRAYARLGNWLTLEANR